jgi:BlaI family penicillinase repressor
MKDILVRGHKPNTNTGSRVKNDADKASLQIRNINRMTHPKLSKLEMQVMEVLWDNGVCSIREVQQAFPESIRPAYTTVQTLINRLEAKQAVRRVKKIGNAHIFEATISRSAAQSRLIDDFMGFFRGRMQPVMNHLIRTGNLTLADVREAEKTRREMAKKGKTK